MFGAHAEWLAHRVLRLRRGSAAARWTVTGAVFALSAVDHWAASVAVDPAGRYWGTVAFYCVQPLAMAVEKAVQSVLGGCVGARAEAWFGRAWVMVWFSMTAGWFFDDIERNGVGKFDGTFTLFGGILGRGWWIK